MRLDEIFGGESPYRKTDLPLSNYRGLSDPRSDDMTAYGKEFDSASDLWDIVDDLIENGVEPAIKEVSISNLLATQDWLSTEEGDGPMWDDYEDYPVVLDYNNQRLILDGHNRISGAQRRGKRTIKVYHFSA